MSLSCGGDFPRPLGRLPCRAPALPLSRRPVQQGTLPGQDSQDLQGHCYATQSHLASHIPVNSSLFFFAFCASGIPPPLSSTSLPFSSSTSTRRLVSTTFPPPRPDNNIKHIPRHRPFHFAPRRNANIQDLCAIIATCSPPPLALPQTDCTHKVIRHDIRQDSNAHPTPLLHFPHHISTAVDTK